MTKREIPELLSPAGNMKCAYAAINCGSDAVYVGGKSFSARNQADNFTLSELGELIDYAHLRGAKVYIAVNTLYKNSEINSVLSFIGEVYSLGADALILQDIGTAVLVKEKFPEIALHASTQMTAHSVRDVMFLKNAGFDRIVLSRELSLDEIKKISALDVETEVFIHGAVCACFSGRCLFSSFTSGRSGNRGVCAQNCRHTYEMLDSGIPIEKGYLLSARDMLTIDIISELAKTGVTSVKIEGRMKSPEYVAITTSSYREALDRLNPNAKTTAIYEDNTVERDLTGIFNRGGAFSSGFFRNYSGKNMMSTKTPKHTGRKIGRVVFVGKGVCTVRLDKGECLKPGDGIEILTKDEPHIGTGINVLIPEGGKLDLDIREETVSVTSGDFVCKSFDKELTDRAKRKMKADNRKLPISGELTIVEGKTPNLTATYSISQKLTIDSSDIGIDELKPVERAVTQSMTKDKIVEQICKTGTSRFMFESLKTDIGENVFIPVSVINSLRRMVLDKMEKLVVLSYKRQQPDKNEKKESHRLNEHRNGFKLSVSVRNHEQLEGALVNGVGRIYIESNGMDISTINYLSEKCHEMQIELYIALPQIERDLSAEGESNYQKLKEAILSSKADGVLARTWGQVFEYSSQDAKKIASDFTFNVLNGISAEFMSNYTESYCLSPELSLREASDISFAGSELIIFGKLPLTTAALCPVGMYKADKGNNLYCECKDDGKFYALRDNNGMVFPIYRDCDSCVCNVLNSKDLFVLNKWDQIADDIGAEWLRLLISFESRNEVDEIVNAHLKIIRGYAADMNVKRFISKKIADGVTNGHLIKAIW